MRPKHLSWAMIMFHWVQPPGKQHLMDVHSSRTCQGAFTGRLLSYTPSTGVTQVLATGFWFSNGVALAADASYVAFVETNRMRVMR